MKWIGPYDFPETAEEIGTWAPTIHLMALHMQVLTVAITRIEGTWTAYGGPVPGLDHNLEYEDVLKHGSNVSEDVARALFEGHGFEDVPYAP